MSVRPSERAFEVRPVGPGEVLREHFLERLCLTQEQLAEALKVSRLSVNQIVNGRRGVTAEMALRLSRVTSTTPDFWLNLQREVDLYEARSKLEPVWSQLRVLRGEKGEAELIVDVTD